MITTMDNQTLAALLERWAGLGWLRLLDTKFASFLLSESPGAPPLLILAAALASHQLGRGHACLDLDQTLADPELALSLPPEGTEDEEGATRPTALLADLDVRSWLAALVDSELIAPGEGNTPLVLAGHRLYLRRYWQYERSVRSAIAARLAQGEALRGELPPAALRRALDSLFPESAARPDWQKMACALAARSAFAVITGGPGTGKTTTVVRLLALLQAIALREAEARPLRIRLAAPTGKAAARLGESISGAVAKLPLAGIAEGERVRAAIPVTVTTLHRLLGSRPDTRHFRHHAGNPLPLDVLVIDEASMMDLEMMAAVLAALPERARLVLLGDKDQLASVEAGAVLGELCRHAQQGRYWPATAEDLAGASGETVDASLLDERGSALDQAVAMLRLSHRFGERSGIGRLAKAVNAGDGALARAVISEPGGELGRVSGSNPAALRTLLIEGDASRAGALGYRHYLETMVRERPGPDATQSALDGWASEVLAAHREFQLLAALRRGPWGVEGLNQLLARWLFEEGLIRAAQGWYPGRPVLVTRNDYGLGLMNGDIGITLALPSADGAEVLRVAFPAEDGIRWVQPSRLQAVETVYALTVHKSQGSEFAHVALALPDRINPVLTRELVYTGITRARSFFTLIEGGGAAVLEQAIARRVLRASGLMAEG